MVTGNLMSAGGQQALRNMIELQLYLLAQPKETPWPLCPRRINRSHEATTPPSPVDWSVARELLDQGFIEATSNRTFVVSRSGFQYYKQMNRLSA